MTQDFAKKKRPRTRKTSSKPRANTRRTATKSQKAPTWAWLVIGLLLAALITLLIYLANQQRAGSSRNSSTPPLAEPKTNKPPQPRFDFYEILKERELEVPDRSAEITAATPENTVYYLQVGSFRRQNDADALRAKLLLANLETAIEEASSKGERWYRVVVGPFQSRSAMAKARSVLASNQLSPLLLRRKVDY
ncbi:MAG: SPOR domain-containing protein [Pseudomonadota bacterium]